ncbi:MAG TPA: DNA polymerase III subunit alpha [Candidatus Paceibacterota bacterium]|nr:DNA polymerase III subunit alpha [Candidatus Paceibacterota bacterium]
MNESKFIHLHCHSHYSLLDGLAKIEDLVAAAKKNNMPALALTDHGNLYGAIEFYKKCKAAGIKPIIGCEIYLAPRKLSDKEPGIDGRNFHLTLLAKNDTGYKNLLRLITIAHLEGFYYKPRVDHETLKKYSGGLICLSGCLKGELSQALLNQDEEKARAVIKCYQDIFGHDYFLEIMHHPVVPRSSEIKKRIIALGQEFQIPIVGTNDVHFVNQEDKKVQDVLLNIQSTGDKKFTLPDDNFSFIDEAKARENFADCPEAVENTKKIADLCDINLMLGNWVFPNIQIPAGSTYDDELRKLANAGFEKRGLKKTPELLARMDYELKIIIEKGYAPYFLVVADILGFAKQNGILATTRGSAAGCLVSYLTYITTVNPIDFNLPFERFLNPERPSPPDIDMDFADNRRDEVIAYVKQKYGSDRVAQIGTFGTMMARGAVRDVTRAQGYPYALGDRIAKLIPFGSQGSPMTIDHAFELMPELKKMYDTERDVKEVINIARRLEGCVRHISVHAAGVVIAPKPLYEFVPTQFDPKERDVITQYDMHSVEEAGLLKFDFLGIRNLAIIADAIERIKKIRNVEIDIDNLPPNDKLTFEKLARGETVGLFQLNGDGMTKYLKELKPTSIHDINVMVALYRPGPMDNINEYIARKHGKKPVTYLHPKMKNFLEPTYGVLVYQDDLLMTAIEVAGYSWSEVDKFRKAVGKKIPAEMKKQHVYFIEGCIKNSKMMKEKAENLWQLFEPFQGYGFNKAHAASYGQVAYQTAYLKAHFPAEYLTASLTAEAGDTDMIAELITECKRLGFQVLPPDINESFSDFTVVRDENEKITNKIRFGLRSIKNFGEEIGKAIIHERKLGGAFKNLADFLTRIQHKNLNKKSLEALIQCGAMDNFGERACLLGSIEDLLRFNKEGNQKAGQAALFAIAPTLRLKEVPPATTEERLAWERELLGLYISGHPLDKYREKLEKLEMNIKKIKDEVRDGAIVTAVGMIEDTRPIFTKKQEQMGFVQLVDLTDSIEVVAFPRVWNGNKFFEKGNLIAVRGRVSLRNNEKSVIIEAVKLL